MTAHAVLPEQRQLPPASASEPESRMPDDRGATELQVGGEGLTCPRSDNREHEGSGS